MLRVLATTLISLAVLIAAAPPVSAHSVSGTYTIPSTPGVSVVCSPNCLGAPGLNLGGHQFPGINEIPASVVIQDASGNPVSYTVCQDLNADSVCGNQNPSVGALEPHTAGCGTSTNLTGFQAGRVTSVFVRAIDGACAGTATSGVITLTYAS